MANSTRTQASSPTRQLADSIGLGEMMDQFRRAARRTRLSRQSVSRTIHKVRKRNYQAR